MTLAVVDEADGARRLAAAPLNEESLIMASAQAETATETKSDAPATAPAPSEPILLPAAGESAASYPSATEAAGETAPQARGANEQPRAPAVEKPQPNPQVDALNLVLRGEMAAIETYRQAIEKAGNEAGDDLQALQRDHRDAAGAIYQHIQKHGGEPAKGAGAWGAFAKAMEGTAKLFGNVTALAVLKEGEEHGVGLYGDTLAKPALDDDCRKLLGELLAKQRQHGAVLERLIAAAGPSPAGA
jgi:rubrerythrin